MALFFDARWFDDRLNEMGADRDALAAHMGLLRADIDMIFKDQRELTPGEVATLAGFISQPVDEVVDRAGIATPSPEAKQPLDRVDRLERRVAALEKQLAALVNQTSGLKD